MSSTLNLSAVAIAELKARLLAMVSAMVGMCFFSRASDYEERGFCGRLLFGQILKFQFWVGCVIFSGDFS
jgi:hypothetical protein